MKQKLKEFLFYVSYTIASETPRMSHFRYLEITFKVQFQLLLTIVVKHFKKCINIEMICSTDTVNMDEKPVEEGIDNKGFVDNVQTNNVTSPEKQSSEKSKSIDRCDSL